MGKYNRTNVPEAAITYLYFIYIKYLVHGMMSCEMFPFLRKRTGITIEILNIRSMKTVQN